MTFIVDGTGSGNRAKVKNNKLQVEAITESSYVHAAEEGEAFNINTFEITVTGAGTNIPLLYIKNNETNPLECVGWFIGQKSASGSGTATPITFKMYGGAVGGTIIDSGVTGTAVNRNLGSPKSFDVDIRVGGSAYDISLVGAPLLYQYHYSGRAFGEVNFVVPQGANIVVVADMPTATYKMYTGFTGYIQDEV